MKNTIIAICLAASSLTLAACSETERGTAIGAASGAIIGGAVTGRAGGAGVQSRAASTTLRMRRNQ